MSANRKWHRHRWPSWCALCTSICMWNISWIITNLIPLLQRQTKLTYSVSDDSIVTRDAIGVQLSKTFSTNFAYISAFASSISNCNRQSQRSIYFPQLYVPSIWAWMIQRGRSRSLVTFWGMGGGNKPKLIDIKELSQFAYSHLYACFKIYTVYLYYSAKVVIIFCQSVQSRLSF